MKHIIWFLFLILMVSCKNERPQKSFFQGQAFGTTFSIQVYSINEIDFEKGIDSVLSKVNNSVSTYILLKYMKLLEVFLIPLLVF
jgi:thiamine biosynthesis lipoprotein